MPTKRSGSPAEPRPTYAKWKAHCAALLEGQGISAGFMREKEWRKLFIQGSSPEDAVRHAGTLHHNSRPLLERTQATAMSDELPFRVVRSNGSDETLARCTNRAGELPRSGAHVPGGPDRVAPGCAPDREEQMKGARPGQDRAQVGHDGDNARRGGGGHGIIKEGVGELRQLFG
jgi:hypothetical protein